MDNNVQALKDKIRERHFSAARFKVNLITTQIDKRKKVSRIMKETEKSKKEALAEEKKSSDEENEEKHYGK